MIHKANTVPYTFVKAYEMATLSEEGNADALEVMACRRLENDIKRFQTSQTKALPPFRALLSKLERGKSP